MIPETTHCAEGLDPLSHTACLDRGEAGCISLCPGETHIICWLRATPPACLTYLRCSEHIQVTALSSHFVSVLLLSKFPGVNSFRMRLGNALTSLCSLSKSRSMIEVFDGPDHGGAGDAPRTLLLYRRSVHCRRDLARADPLRASKTTSDEWNKDEHAYVHVSPEIYSSWQHGIQLRKQPNKGEVYTSINRMSSYAQRPGWTVGAVYKTG